MSIDETLQALRELATAESWSNDWAWQTLFQDLDERLTKGSTPPHDWQHGPHATWIRPIKTGD